MTSFSPYLPRQYTPWIFTNAIRARLVLLFAVSILKPPSNCAIMYCGKHVYKNISLLVTYVYTYTRLSRPIRYATRDVYWGWTGWRYWWGWLVLCRILKP